MPFKSRSQQRWMYATDPKMAKKWADHTPDFKKLPERVGEKDTEKKGFFPMDPIKLLGSAAAEHRMVEKLASDTQITPELVRTLAGMVKMSSVAFVKAAYADPADYTIFLKLASGAVKVAGLPGGATVGKLGGKIVDFMRRAHEGARGSTTHTGGAFGTSKAQGRVGRAIENAPLGMNRYTKSQAGRAATGTAAATAVGGAGYAGGKMAFGGKPQAGAPAQAGPHEAAVSAQTAPPAPQPAPAQSNGPAANPAPAQGGKGGGMSTGMKAGLGVAGVAAGAAGAGAMMKKRKAKKEVTARDLVSEAAKDFMLAFAVKKAAELYRKHAADKFVSYLDKVASVMPFEKTAQVRMVQVAVSAGKPLSHAIKMAYPQLNGEQRGILAYKLVKAASQFVANRKKSSGSPGYKIQSRTETSCKPCDAGKAMQKMGSVQGKEKQARYGRTALMQRLQTQLAAAKGRKPMPKMPGGAGSEYAGMGPRMGTVPRPTMPTQTPASPAQAAAQPPRHILDSVPGLMPKA